MQLSQAQQELVASVKADVEKGLTTDEAAARREKQGSFNTVEPPINCPSWVCCLLPCINHVPSMQAFARIKPDDAELKRNGKWIRYDAASLVIGDIIRLEEGDVVPADCVVLTLEEGTSELLVDHRSVTGEEKPRSAKRRGNFVQPTQLFWGGRVVLGSAIAVTTAVGSDTLVASLIRDGRFPPKGDIVTTDDDADEEAGISLMARGPT
ncbi:hypothetical protein FisN_5Hh518 [Fistulifera solaris]|jgi:hypothetical protein|uniref:Uncharacterized protein n=1 Tax=Fistulifera solaris TaxID=1519565 RepID=A0A1Z5JTE1_FISSO|nr:hypothetical protein FisN_5Hh518 [Fistulifera solaris]|eukprot:GAX17132.1 hypothetical protein FisN_5Hh518 [Fistulifera solaris]